ILAGTRQHHGSAVRELHTHVHIDSSCQLLAFRVLSNDPLRGDPLHRRVEGVLCVDEGHETASCRPMEISVSLYRARSNSGFDISSRTPAASSESISSSARSSGAATRRPLTVRAAPIIFA